MMSTTIFLIDSSNLMSLRVYTQPEHLVKIRLDSVNHKQNEMYVSKICIASTFRLDRSLGVSRHALDFVALCLVWRIA